MSNTWFKILYLIPFRQKSSVSLQNIAQAYLRTVGRLPQPDMRINNWTAWRCSSIPLQWSRSGATLNNKYDNVCTTLLPYDMNTIYQKKTWNRVTHITEMEFNLFMLHSRLLSDSTVRTSVLSDVPDHPGGPKSDWLNSTKESKGFPESRPSLRFYFFFRETLIQGTFLCVLC